MVTWSVTMLGADMLGLLLHLLHQPGALDDVGKARIVLDVGGDGELAAGLDALDQDRLEHGARGIDRGGVAGRAGADDHDFGVGSFGHGRAPLAGVGLMWPRRWPAGRLLLPRAIYGFRPSYARYATRRTQPAMLGWRISPDSAQ